jgi:hypothetical protein
MELAIERVKSHGFIAHTYIYTYIRAYVRDNGYGVVITAASRIQEDG